jgi:putative aldouronate transport system permease protein
MFLPKKIHFQNYTDVIKIPGLTHAALVSVERTVLGTCGTLLGSAFLGFMFTQEDLKGRRFWYRYTVITMYIGAGLIPWYITMMNLHLTNNFWAYILPAIVQPFNIILVKTYIESTPKELQEAAKIDGAGTLKIFSRIIIPIAKPILATVAIFSSVGQWNAFQDTLILMTDSKQYTLQYVLYQYINQSSSLAALIKNGVGDAVIQNIARAQTPTSVRMTVTVIVVIPILVVYPIFQKFYVKGIMIGSVKG